MARDREPGGDSDDDIYTRHIATPTGLDFADAAALYGLAHERVADVARLRAALERALAPADGSSIVEVRSERAAQRRAARAQRVGAPSSRARSAR